MQYHVPTPIVFAVDVGRYEGGWHLIAISVIDQLLVNDMYGQVVGFEPMFVEDFDVKFHVGRKDLFPTLAHRDAPLNLRTHGLNTNDLVAIGPGGHHLVYIAFLERVVKCVFRVLRGFESFAHLSS